MYKCINKLLTLKSTESEHLHAGSEFSILELVKIAISIFDSHAFQEVPVYTFLSLATCINASTRLLSAGFLPVGHVLNAVCTRVWIWPVFFTSVHTTAPTLRYNVTSSG